VQGGGEGADRGDSSVDTHNMRHREARGQVTKPVVNTCRTAVIKGGPNGVGRVDEELGNRSLDVAHNVVHLSREGVQYVLSGAKWHATNHDACRLTMDDTAVSLWHRRCEGTKRYARTQPPGAGAEVVGRGKARRFPNLQTQVESRSHSSSKAHDGREDNRGRACSIYVIHNAASTAAERPKLIIKCLQLRLDADAEDT
jgi:hypothetical protein